MKLSHGIFTISLDFELYWGVRDKGNISQYKTNLEGVRKAVPEMLRVFSSSNIHATWATVGFLFFNDSEDLTENLPKLTPTYEREQLSPYEYIKDSANLDFRYHFAPDLIKLISESKDQEVATHTFSHYYCLEEGQSLEQFEEDINAAKKIAEREGLSFKSLVFPRNQWNEEYLSSLVGHGILCYRGNESSWIYKASDDEGQNRIQRAFRLADAYFNISGHNVYSLPEHTHYKPINLPSSRFLRPYSKKLSFLDGIRLRRIKKSMNYAAINKKVFHLWWHPHNFGANINENVGFLSEILKHYVLLNSKYGFKSLNMGEIVDLLEANNGE